MTPEEILIEQGIMYTPKGSSLLIHCLNPDHEDNNPSMHVNKNTGMFHCFSCNAKGNLNTRFNKVVSVLTTTQQNILDIIRNTQQTILEMPKDNTPFMEDYRGISSETFKHFNVFKSIAEFDGRIVLPIYNFKNELVSFIGRFHHSKLDPKYKVLPKGRALPLFPPPVDLKGNTKLILVEGMFDLLNLYDKGLTNVITSFGLLEPKKRGKNDRVLDLLIPYKLLGITHLYIMYDGDDPGIKASDKLKILLEDIFVCDNIILPKGLDPGDMNQEQVNNVKEMIS